MVDRLGGVYCADCLEHLKTLASNSVDSLVTDPPAGISFMGKEWDHNKGGRDEWIKWMESVMHECLRVLKPGAHGFVWAIPRTSHWTATALENAGFEVRDVITHLFGSGFPKSHDISKGIDKQAGADREVIGKLKWPCSNINATAALHGAFQESPDITAPSTDSAKEWQGWGTALKPAAEMWVLVRKPCSEKTVAANVIKYGTGGINIDASRVDLKEGETTHGSGANQGGEIYSGEGSGFNNIRKDVPNIKSTQGRFPANLILSHSDHCEDDRCDMFCPIAMLDAQSGTRASGGSIKSPETSTRFKNTHSQCGAQPEWAGYIDTVGASRFFYCAKTSKSERNAGLEGMPQRQSGVMQDDSYKWTHDGKGNKINLDTCSANHHPTVKPQKLMQYLIRMITPPEGTVLDPFMGSGSTGVAAKSLGFGFIGIEREKEYFDIAQKRIG